MSDKRSVHTDALETLGTIFEHGERDAIHLAVEPAIAGERLQPGDDIGILNGKAYNKSRVIKKLGIVDPFLRQAVEEGQQFWLVVYPRQITSLRHVWSHPDFEEPEESKIKIAEKITEQLLGTHEKWLRNWCEQTQDAPTYEELIEIFKTGQAKGDDIGYGNVRWENQGDYLLSRGRDAYGDIPDEVYDHLEKIIGEEITERPSHFSCSC